MMKPLTAYLNALMTIKLHKKEKGKLIILNSNSNETPFYIKIIEKNSNKNEWIIEPMKIEIIDINKNSDKFISCPNFKPMKHIFYK